MSKKPRYAMRVIKGGFTPADVSTASALRGKYRVGDLVFAEFTKPRNPGFHRLAHQLGSMLTHNLDDFDGMTGHQVLKRLQIEGNIACDEIRLYDDYGEFVKYRIPQSLSYESMDEAEFHEVIGRMCKYVSDNYWNDLTPEQIEEMASVWVEMT